ncbi:glycoside hydrolase family 26 protein [Pseudorhodoferax sp. Leaf267]|uniref:glycoside hydrolase family 26 protein n=1 Tax=Pseudorhodoferax sp. Leaf267 TaxID=1736316 RepID=UPI000714A2CB|nr:glycosyl hydrolase [Pseudorhodoferax sp. Leaf267]KQP17924.1 hypothetical protein ASF43_08650 [Pseudorhodoferax sp. Leaf267]
MGLKHFLAGVLLCASGGFAAAATDMASSLGFYLGPGCNGTARVPLTEKWLGRRPARAIDFFSNESWAQLVSAANRGSRCWQATGLQMTFSVPMLPKDGSSTLAEGAQGAYNEHFVKVAQTLVQNGYADAVVRIGWEFNHSWFPWRAAQNPEAWVTYWRQIVTAMRSVPGAQFRFDWCPAWGKGELDPEDVYPGDEYVDIIGLDIYNVSWNPRNAQDRWTLKRTYTNGLEWHRKFAASRGKPVSFPEWGTGKRPDGRGGGDDPYYIQKMTDWIQNSNLAYHNYWDYGARDFNGTISNGNMPNSEGEFLRILGGAK